MKRTLLLLFMSLALSVGAGAQNFSDIININTLVEAFKYGRALKPVLLEHGYKYDDYHALNQLNTWGFNEYYKNCTVDNDGNPVTFSKGNTSLVKIGDLIYGPFVSLEVYNNKAFNYIYNKLISSGFKRVAMGVYVETSLKKGNIYVDYSRNEAHEGGMFIILNQ